MCGVCVLFGGVCVCFCVFQAEDGIRDSSVTGVQTCALPISHTQTHTDTHTDTDTQGDTHICTTRSEERRVGKECRSPWSPYHSKKKNTHTHPHTSHISSNKHSNCTYMRHRER